MAHPEALTPALLERVLMKLGLSEHPASTLDGLQTLYAAWCRKVPFDNVRKLIYVHQHDPSPLPGDEATDFFEAWLAYGTGGTCWAGNGALYTLLVTLGFEASRGRGTMLVAPTSPPIMARCSSPIPTVSPAKDYIDHPVWGSHPEEAKRGPPSGPRIPRNEGAMMALLLP